MSAASSLRRTTARLRPYSAALRSGSLVLTFFWWAVASQKPTPAYARRFFTGGFWIGSSSPESEATFHGSSWLPTSCCFHPRGKACLGLFSRRWRRVHQFLAAISLRFGRSRGASTRYQHCPCRSPTTSGQRGHTRSSAPAPHPQIGLARGIIFPRLPTESWHASRSMSRCGSGLPQPARSPAALRSSSTIFSATRDPSCASPEARFSARRRQIASKYN